MIPVKLAAFLLAPLLFVGCATIENAARSSAQIGGNVIKAGAEIGGAVAASATTGLNPQEEHQLGRDVAVKILAEHPLVDGGDYINLLGQSLSRFSARPELYRGYRFAVVEGEQPRAMPIPGGFVFVTKGLVTGLTSETDLARILARQIAHVAVGNSSRLAENATGIANVLLGPGIPANLEQSAGLAAARILGGAGFGSADTPAQTARFGTFKSAL